MSSPYLAEIRIFSFNFAPKGWALSNGQLLPINQNQALFSLLGTTYGGNGTTTFALPNLQGSIPFHRGNGFSQGQVGGEEAHTLTLSEMPAHTHVVTASSAVADQNVTAGTVWAQAPSAYDSTLGPAMSTIEVPSAGSSQPHENRPPFLVLNFCITLQGIFPSQT